MSETDMSDQSTVIQETDVQTVEGVLAYINMKTESSFSFENPKDTLQDISSDYLTENFGTIVEFECDGKEFKVYELLSGDLFYVDTQNSSEFKTFEGVIEESKDQIDKIVGMCERRSAESKTDGQIETEVEEIEEYALSYF